jgi:hypothetical protein
MILSFTLAKDSVGDKQWTSLALSDIEIMNRRYSLMRTQVEKVYSGEDGRVQQLFCDKVPAVKKLKTERF